jgi:hypothetical protein
MDLDPKGHDDLVARVPSTAPDGPRAGPVHVNGGLHARVKYCSQ